MAQQQQRGSALGMALLLSSTGSPPELKGSFAHTALCWQQQERMMNTDTVLMMEGRPQELDSHPLSPSCLLSYFKPHLVHLLAINWPKCLVAWPPWRGPVANLKCTGVFSPHLLLGPPTLQTGPGAPVTSPGHGVSSPKLAAALAEQTWLGFHSHSQKVGAAFPTSLGDPRLAQESGDPASNCHPTLASQSL